MTSTFCQDCSLNLLQLLVTQNKIVFISPGRSTGRLHHLVGQHSPGRLYHLVGHSPGRSTGRLHHLVGHSPGRSTGRLYHLVGYITW